MTQGIWIMNGVTGQRRPKSKKEVKEYIAADKADEVYLEATSMFGNEYDGPLSMMPEGDSNMAFFVGPDPYTKRVFYGNVVRKGDKVVVK